MQTAQRAALDKRRCRSRRRDDDPSRRGNKANGKFFLIIILIAVINERIMVMACDRKEQLPESLSVRDAETRRGRNCRLTCTHARTCARGELPVAGLHTRLHGYSGSRVHQIPEIGCSRTDT